MGGDSVSRGMDRGETAGAQMCSEWTRTSDSPLEARLLVEYEADHK